MKMWHVGNKENILKITDCDICLQGNMNNIHGRSSLMLGMIHQRDNIVDQRELSLLRYLSIYDARNGAQLII